MRGWTGTLLLSLLCALSACGPGVSGGFDPADAGPGNPPIGVPPTQPPIVRGPVPVLVRVSAEFVDVEAVDVRVHAMGTGFTSASTLYWRGQALQTTFVNDTLLEGVLRIGAEGLDFNAASLTVRNPNTVNGTSVGFSLGYPYAHLTSLTPDNLFADPEGPVRVTLTGRNFVAGSKVLFRGGEYPATVLSPTQAEVELPASALTVWSGTSQTGQGHHDLALRVTRRQPHASNNLVLELRNPVPRIEGVHPSVLSTAQAGGISDGGTAPQVTPSLQIHGRDMPPGTVVKWNGRRLEGGFRSSRDTFNFAPPLEVLATPGTVSLTLEAPGPGGGESAPFLLQVVDGPVLHSVSPQRVAAGMADVVLELNGEGFEGSPAVYCNGRPLATESDPYGSWGGRFVRATLPAQLTLQPGAYSITVGRRRDGAVSEALLVEAVDEAPAPLVSSLEPAVLSVGDTPVRLNVRGQFGTGSAIFINGEVRTTRVESSGMLSTQLESWDLAEAGVRMVTVRTPGPGGGTSLPLLLKVDARRKVPLLTGLSPQSVTAGSGALKIHLTGHGLGPYSLVRWNGEVLTARWGTFCYDSNYRLESCLEADVPASRLTQAGQARVTVFNPAPGGGLSAALGFSIAEPGSPAAYASWPFLLTVEAGAPEQYVELRGVTYTAETRVLVDGEPRVPRYQSSTVVGVELGAADLAVPRTVELRTQNPGDPPSRPVLFAVLPPRPPHLSSIYPGVVSTGELPGQKRQLIASGVGLAWKDYFSSNESVASTLDWGGTAHPLTYVNWPTYGLGTELPDADVATVGALEVSVSRAAEEGIASLPALLNVVAARPVPHLTAVEPAIARAGASALRLYVSGQGFHAASVVHWNGEPVPTRWVQRYYTYWQLEAVVPGSLLTTPGAARVTVHTPAPGGGTSLPVTVSVR